MRKLLMPVWIALAMMVLEASAWAQGCANCRTALESSPEGRVMASSFAHGIVMMLFLPYTLFGIFAFIVYRAFRKRSKLVAQAELDQPPSVK